jgi:hypothetical protein
MIFLTSGIGRIIEVVDYREKIDYDWCESGLNPTPRGVLVYLMLSICKWYLY